MRTMFLVRNVSKDDLTDLLNLAQKVNFINLPANRKELKKIISLSEKSFAGKIDPEDSRFLFVLEDTDKKQLVVTSMILAQHGTPEEPHLYFKVLDKKKHSKTIKKKFLHKVLRLGFDYDGPTELGALMVHPKYRGHPERLGLFLSFIRLVYIKARREFIRDQLLVELMPPLNKDNESTLWASVGKKFTGLDYWVADKKSRLDKEFVTSLFPEGDIYINMLPEVAQNAIGQVGEATRPVQRILSSIGFKYSNMIDPFDGGPHYWANTDEISLIKKTKLVHLESETTGLNLHKQHGILLALNKKSCVAFQCDVRLQNNKRISRLFIDDETIRKTLSGKFKEAYFLELES